MNNITKDRTVYTSYVPHGINAEVFHPIDENSPRYAEYQEFRKNFQKDNPHTFLVFWNNRNIRRKQPGDVILSYKLFCDSLPKKESERVVLLMHSQIRDENGTDLLAVKEAVCKEYTILFSDQKVSSEHLNFFYNLADVTLNIASNEGFGLSGAESIMSGTPIVNNATGGLQDQCRFEDEQGNWISFDSEYSSNHLGRYRKEGVWSKAVFPTNRSLQGSLPTPYIFDDRCDVKDVAEALKYWYDMSREDRKLRGLEGRKWAMSSEARLSSKEMCNGFVRCLDFLIDNWKKPNSFTIYSATDKSNNITKNSGITW